MSHSQTGIADHHSLVYANANAAEGGSHVFPFLDGLIGQQERLCGNMKIAVVIPKYGLVGGAEGFAYELTERLAMGGAVRDARIFKPASQRECPCHIS